MDKKEILKYFKEYSFLIFLIIYIIVNVYLGGKIDLANLLIVTGFVLLLNALSILIIPYLVDYKKLKEISTKMKELQKNPFSALTMEKDLLELLNEQQKITMRYSLVTMLIFIVGIMMLTSLVHGNVFGDFKLELPYLGGTMSAFVFYIVLSLSLAPLFTSRKKNLGLF